MRIFSLLLTPLLALSACMPTMETVGKRVDAEEPQHLYQGEHKPPPALAQISIVGQSGKSYIEVFDGVERRGSSWSDKAFVYMLPGKHQLKARYLFGGTFTDGQVTELVELNETLEADHSYALHFTYTDDTKTKVRFRLVDYGAAVPRRCVGLGLRDGGPKTPQPSSSAFAVKPNPSVKGTCLRQAPYVERLGPSVMPSVNRSLLSLRVFGDHLVPGEVSAMLGSEPTESYKQGDKRISSGKEYTRKYGMWLLKATEREPEDIEGQIAELLSGLSQDLSVWRKLAATFSTRSLVWGCSWKSQMKASSSQRQRSRLSVSGELELVSISTIPRRWNMMKSHLQRGLTPQSRGQIAAGRNLPLTSKR